MYKKLDIINEGKVEVGLILEEKKSLRVNFIFYFLKQLMSIIFPIISYPYAARVLGVDGIGKVDYANSIITYFVLLAGLGIGNYAIREGAKIRDDKEKLNKFVNEMLIINALSTLISFILCIVIINMKIFESYKNILLIYSIIIPFTSIGVEWVFSIQEDYKYITTRATMFQILSLIALIVFVKNKNDYIIYAFIIVFSNVGSNVLNFLYCKKYVKLFKNRNCKILVHIKPIIIIFGMSIATKIYLIMDTTMLGILTTDYAVGLYSGINKIINILVCLISTIRTVLMPRLSHSIKDGNMNNFNKMNDITIQIILLFSIPLVVGIFCLSNEIITVFYGKDYLPSALTLRIYIPDIIIAALNGTIIFQVLYPLNKEKITLVITIIGGIVNVIFNYIFIPLYQQNGAAIGTCMAEISIFICCLFWSRKYIKFAKYINSLIQYIFASFGIIVVCFINNMLLENSIIKILFSVPISIFIYFILLFLMRNNIILTVICSFKKQIRKKFININL